MPHVAVTAVGVDRPGIVAAVTGVLLEHGGNLEDTAMTRLGGHFAMVLVVEVAEDAAPLEAALSAAATPLGLTVTVRSIAEVGDADDEGTPYAVSVHGADRPGIVHRVTSVLAEHGANIVDLATHRLTTDSGTGYVVLLEVLVPTDPDALRGALRQVASKLGVDVTMRADEAEIPLIRPVRLFPDPVLSGVCEPVGEVDDDALALARDLLDTIRGSSHSVGVAAPQIGVARRAFCFDVTDHPKARSCHGEVVLFDPVVVERHGTDVGREGCMSVPDLTGDVARSSTLVVRGLGVDGAERAPLEVDAFEAHAVQHELDHVDGLLFLDRVVARDRLYRRRSYR